MQKKQHIFDQILFAIEDILKLPAIDQLMNEPSSNNDSKIQEQQISAPKPKNSGFSYLAYAQDQQKENPKSNEEKLQKKWYTNLQMFFHCLDTSVIMAFIEICRTKHSETLPQTTNFFKIKFPDQFSKVVINTQEKADEETENSGPSETEQEEIAKKQSKEAAENAANAAKQAAELLKKQSEKEWLTPYVQDLQANFTAFFEPQSTFDNLSFVFEQEMGIEQKKINEMFQFLQSHFSDVFMNNEKDTLLFTIQKNLKNFISKQVKKLEQFKSKEDEEKEKKKKNKKDKKRNKKHKNSKENAEEDNSEINNEESTENTNNNEESTENKSDEEDSNKEDDDSEDFETIQNDEELDDDFDFEMNPTEKKKKKAERAIVKQVQDYQDKLDNINGDIEENENETEHLKKKKENHLKNLQNAAPQNSANGGFEYLAQKKNFETKLKSCDFQIQLCKKKQDILIAEKLKVQNLLKQVSSSLSIQTGYEEGSESVFGQGTRTDEGTFSKHHLLLLLYLALQKIVFFLILQQLFGMQLEDIAEFWSNLAVVQNALKEKSLKTRFFSLFHFVNAVQKAFEIQPKQTMAQNLANLQQLTQNLMKSSTTLAQKQQKEQQKKEIQEIQQILIPNTNLFNTMPQNLKAEVRAGHMVFEETYEVADHLCTLLINNFGRDPFFSEVPLMTLFIFEDFKNFALRFDMTSKLFQKDLYDATIRRLRVSKKAFRPKYYNSRKVRCDSCHSFVISQISIFFFQQNYF